VALGDPAPRYPRGSKKAVFPGTPGEGPKTRFLGIFSQNPGFPGIWGSRAPEGPPGRPGTAGLRREGLM